MSWTIQLAPTYKVMFCFCLSYPVPFMGPLAQPVQSSICLLDGVDPPGPTHTA